jgi:hypothetical protein
MFLKQFYFFMPGLKIISHGNPDNNLESPCIYGWLVGKNSEMDICTLCQDTSSVPASKTEENRGNS